MKCILIGGGGHGRVLIEALEPGQIHGVIDSQPDLKEVCGVPVIGGDDQLVGLVSLGYTHFIIGVGSSKSCARRTALFDQAIRAGLQPQSVIHPTAYVAQSASCGAGCQILPRAVVHTSARLAEHVLVNTAAVVEHDCSIGAHVHIATGAVVCGGVQIGAAAHIGAGAVIRQGIRIGSRALIGAGAVVIRDVEAETVVVGVPARELEDHCL
jgi:sugar O-acyltransferase (sialic acid O-acetyltransferase NeuD family)